MTGLVQLSQCVPDVLAQLFQALRDAEEARPRERHAAVVVQKYARGFLTRRRLDKLAKQVLCMQRCWRGYLGRQLATQAKEARDKRLRAEYFSAMAITIQRFWRGFWSRKYVFDFQARKRYLQRVAQVNAKMREVLAEEGDRAAHTQKAIAEAAAQAAFSNKISKLHHLLSTASQPGIFASPYQVAAGTVPVVAGAPVEAHLRSAFKKSATAGGSFTQSRSSAATFLPPIKGAAGMLQSDSTQQMGSMGGSKQGSPGGATGRAGSRYASSGTNGRFSTPPRTVFMSGLNTNVPAHASLRQVVPYDTVRQAELLDCKVVKAEMMNMHALPFRYAHSHSDQPHLDIQSNRNLEGYEDPWDPTVGARTETFTPKQQATAPYQFGKYGGHRTYFDAELNRDEAHTTLPPKTYSQQITVSPAYSAGLSVAEVRLKAKEPPR
mmetsp:Transcript_10360/g.18005  ORF Transcript_10360/g.18005 Transcript_10360/m.18005 type:complete len:436 (+) Transcript_10360:97-1404(+)|eukprot:CAMPEP_0119113984 /NCGR_PEP_ID=MMETSP1180-20130426/45830_1 /TAXON_ID=3052 ORGANISM="Chlamydomonas cf sp, Strain CCMP681" /NCGR_SAMPLE_ID=MMETSP1180 /ASSEMBLY_ACC=CAM_ASM_000741 /LENGTH=435 /DNA_ID=CAMNT_0007102325 /DNA_START=77 /DNA_END=1384 /DNA_ORIENTATION=+